MEGDAGLWYRWKKASSRSPGSSQAPYSHLALRPEVWDFVPLHQLSPGTGSPWGGGKIFLAKGS